MSDIVYPTLDLFLYDLREGLGDTSAEVDRNREKFKQKLPANVGKDLFAKDNKVEAEYIPLLGKQKVEEFEDIKKCYQGYYYPVCINDAYGLQVDCSINDKSAPQPAECFAELKEEIQQNQLQGAQGTIGQTWMISGWLPEGSEKTPAEIAEACYAALTNSQRWEKDLQGQGKLMGADIFELSQYRIVMEENATRNTTIQEIQDNHHVIIIIYPDRKTEELAGSFYKGWMSMFLFRHKVLWNYGQSRILKHESKGKFSQIENFELDINKGIKKGREIDFLNENVQKMQGSFSHYIQSLKTLDLLKGTIEINLKNYQRAEIAQKKKALKLKAEAETNLEFLDIFITDFKENYWEQITKDKSNLWTAMKLLQEVIKATESTVAVEKVKRDKNFQELLTDLGVGWAVGSFLAGRLKTEDKLSLENIGSVEKLISVETLQDYAILLAPPVGAAIAAALLFRFGRFLLVRSDVLSQLYSLTVGKIVDKLKK
ncbi:MAG: hypothetical protein AB4352_26775 [Hormoscilla sp.]